MEQLEAPHWSLKRTTEPESGLFDDVIRNIHDAVGGVWNKLVLERDEFYLMGYYL